jgi:hypothetical protein
MAVAVRKKMRAAVSSNSSSIMATPTLPICRNGDQIFPDRGEKSSSEDGAASHQADMAGEVPQSQATKPRPARKSTARSLAWVSRKNTAKPLLVVLQVTRAPKYFWHPGCVVGRTPDLNVDKTGQIFRNVLFPSPVGLN